MGQPISLKLNTNHKCALLKKSEKVQIHKTGNYKKKKNGKINSSYLINIFSKAQWNCKKKYIKKRTVCTRF